MDTPPKPDPSRGPNDPSASENEPEENTSAGEITLLLEQWVSGEEGAGEPLLRLVYDELRNLAGRYLRRERSDHTLPPTGLVHEAYMRIARADLKGVVVKNRVHFFAIAAQAMRRILVEHARRYQADRRPSPHQREELLEDGSWTRLEPQIHELLEVDQALDRLRKAHPRRAQIVELRYFAGLTEQETAEALNLSRATVARDWKVARLLLSRFLKSEPKPRQHSEPDP